MGYFRLIAINSVNLKEKDTITTYINSVVKQARGEYLFLISGNVKLIDNRCLVELLANCQRKEVGIVGGKVYNAGGKIQNAGMGRLCILQGYGLDIGTVIRTQEGILKYDSNH